jgi:hypothetical protein
MNPYIIIAVLLAIAGAFAGGEIDGQKRGDADRVIADQKQFDAINAKITAQKAEANSLLEKAQADIITAQAAADSFKTQLEKDSETRQTQIDTLRRQYAGVSLRFKSSQAPGCGASGAITNSTQGTAASPNGGAVIQLPDQVTADLRQLTVDGDNLISEYKKCRDFVYR